MDMEYLLALQQFREGAGHVFTEFFEQMSFLSDKGTVIVIVAIVYWCVSKRYGAWLWLGWSTNRLINGFLKATACVYRPWIRDARILPDPPAKAGATGYSFPSGHSTNGASMFGSGMLYSKFRKGLRILFGVMVVLVALSRNFLGVHTPQDVIVGASLGLLVMYLTSKLITYLDAHPEKEIAAAVIGIGGHAGTTVDSFLQIFYIVYIFPLICMKFERRL
ncbi:MAG: phosphatase PAP2 family protein [Lachnospiraceae bacterium]|nr:phosphatase PAP2 family protein [Lachnospiraceae bacterium]